MATISRILILVCVAVSSLSLAGESLRFPPNFRWCVATSAHQIEGGNNNSDWWDYEQIPGAIKNGEKSGLACDHWNRLEEDVRLIQDLGVGTYRFSVEWAKIEPRQGEWDWDAIRHYQHEIALLRQAGIEPMVTLHHFTLPRWVRALGGWEWAGAPRAFAHFAGLMYEALGADVRDWITFNEPMVNLVSGYLAGIGPPAKKVGLEETVVPIRGMLLAHASAYRTLHDMAGKRPVRVGLAHHVRIFDPKHRLSWLDKKGARILDQVFNWAFIDAVETGNLRLSIPFALKMNETIPGLKGTQDFLGVNYYTRDIVDFSIKSPPLFLDRIVRPGAPINDMNWEIYPLGFYRVLKHLASRYPGKPIIVTENGIADSRDDRRMAFLDSHLKFMHRAIEEGVPVEGYCHWSLMDNFEWNEGFGPRFGLYEVDYATFKRTPRASAYHYRRIIQDNAVEIEQR